MIRQGDVLLVLRETPKESRQHTDMLGDCASRVSVSDTRTYCQLRYTRPRPVTLCSTWMSLPRSLTKSMPQVTNHSDK